MNIKIKSVLLLCFMYFISLGNTHANNTNPITLPCNAESKCNVLQNKLNTLRSLYGTQNKRLLDPYTMVYGDSDYVKKIKLQRDIIIGEIHTEVFGLLPNEDTKKNGGGALFKVMKENVTNKNLTGLNNSLGESELFENESSDIVVLLKDLNNYKNNILVLGNIDNSQYITILKKAAGKSQVINDTEEPATPVIVLSGSITTTNSQNVDINITANDNIGVVGYYLSEDNSKPSANAMGWTSVKPTTFLLSEGNGNKTIYVFTKDGAGNVSNGGNISITLSVSNDIIPDAYDFTDIIDSELSTLLTSNTILISGIDNTTTFQTNTGTIIKNGTDTGTGMVNVINGDIVSIRLTSSASDNTTITVITKAGGEDGLEDTFIVRTKLLPLFETVWRVPSGNSTDRTVSFNTRQTGYCIVEWGDGTQTNCANVNTKIYATAGDKTIRIKGGIHRFFTTDINSDLYSKKLIRVNKWDNITWTSMQYMFLWATNLTVLPTEAPILTNITDMSSMFQQSGGIGQSLNHWNTSSVTNLSMAFRDSRFAGDISLWNVSNVTNLNSTFMGNNHINNMSNWIDLSGWNTANVTDFRGIFNGTNWQFTAYPYLWNTTKSLHKTGSPILLGSNTNPGPYSGNLHLKSVDNQGVLLYNTCIIPPRYTTSNGTILGAAQNPDGTMFLTTEGLGTATITPVGGLCTNNTPMTFTVGNACPAGEKTYVAPFDYGTNTNQISCYFEPVNLLSLDPSDTANMFQIYNDKIYYRSGKGSSAGGLISMNLDGSVKQVPIHTGIRDFTINSAGNLIVIDEYDQVLLWPNINDTQNYMSLFSVDTRNVFTNFQASSIFTTGDYNSGNLRIYTIGNGYDANNDTMKTSIWEIDPYNYIFSPIGEITIGEEDGINEFLLHPSYPSKILITINGTSIVLDYFSGIWIDQNTNPEPNIIDPSVLQNLINIRQTLNYGGFNYTINDTNGWLYKTK